jgi:hypothetical protein
MPIVINEMIQFMFKRNAIVVYILIISTVIINSCSRDKTPTDSYDNIYIESWADTVSACGIGVPNADLEPEAQRAGAIRAASLNMFIAIIDIIHGLPISNTQIINDLITENNEIQDQIAAYINDKRIVTEETFFEDGNVEVCGCLPTDGIKTIILPYLLD